MVATLECESNQIIFHVIMRALVKKYPLVQQLTLGGLNKKFEFGFVEFL
jgi:hypothetical protein